MDDQKNHSFASVVCNKLDSLQDSLDTLTQIMTGNGDPSKGLIVRVDRLEQSANIARKVFWILFGALITPASIGGFIWYLLSNHAH